MIHAQLVSAVEHKDSFKCLTFTDVLLAKQRLDAVSGGRAILVCKMAAESLPCWHVSIVHWEPTDGSLRGFTRTHDNVLHNNPSLQTPELAPAITNIIWLSQVTRQGKLTLVGLQSSSRQSMIVCWWSSSVIPSC